MTAEELLAIIGRLEIAYPHHITLDRYETSRLIVHWQNSGMSKSQSFTEWLETFPSEAEAVMFKLTHL